MPKYNIKSYTPKFLQLYTSIQCQNVPWNTHTTTESNILANWMQAKLVIAPGCWDMRYRQTSARMVLRQHNPRYIGKLIFTNILNFFTFLRYIVNLKSKNILEVLHSQDMYIEKFISKNILEAFECNTSLDMLEICTNQNCKSREGVWIRLQSSSKPVYRRHFHYNHSAGPSSS